jgi:hypothetical protein
VTSGCCWSVLLREESRVETREPRDNSRLLLECVVDGGCGVGNGHENESQR